MDFLEYNYLYYLRDKSNREPYQYRDRNCEKLLRELSDEEFRNNFQFTKQDVRDIATILHDRLG